MTTSACAFDFAKENTESSTATKRFARRPCIVCYLSDDDLLLRDHAAEMALLLEDADFAHSVSARLAVDGTPEYSPGTSPGPSSWKSASAARRRSGSRAPPTRSRRTAGCRTDGGRLRLEGQPTTTCGGNGSSCPGSAVR